MPDIQYLEPDINYKVEFTKGLKRRDLEQKYIYSDENALNYYSTRNILSTEDIQDHEYYSLVHDKIPKGQKILFISLGCGNSQREIGLINKLIQDGYNIQYYAVDASKQMLTLSSQNLEGTNIPHTLIQADITSSSFSSTFTDLMKEYEFTIISILGRTMGNMVQTEIVDSLYNLSQKGNLILIDIVTRTGDDQIDKIRLFKKYAQRLESEEKMAFYFHPLKNIQIPYSNGRMEVHASTEDSIGVQKFRYMFRLEKPTQITYNDQTVHLLPPEVIKLLDIRCYYPPTFIKFFEQHTMKLVEQFHKNSIGLFLFERQ